MSNSEALNRSGDLDIATPGHELRTIRRTYRRLRMVGLSDAEAGNLTARLNGLAIVEKGWTVQEIERLLFIRALVDLNRLSS
jgi:hypothetical protein